MSLVVAFAVKEISDRISQRLTIVAGAASAGEVERDGGVRQVNDRFSNMASRGLQTFTLGDILFHAIFVLYSHVCVELRNGRH